MTLLEQTTLLHELIHALKLMQTVDFASPRKSDAVQHLEWAIAGLAKDIWWRNSKEVVA